MGRAMETARTTQDSTVHVVPFSRESNTVLTGRKVQGE